MLSVSKLMTCNPVKASSVAFLRNFCDKMVTSFLPSFLSLILRQRRVNEMGTQQLLLDVYNLKTLMLQVPSIGGWVSPMFA